MRSMGSRAGLAGLVMALATLASAASASATPAFQPAGTAFTATSTGEQVFAINANVKWRCDHAVLTGTTANPASDTVSVSAAYGDMAAAGKWCRLYVGGVFSAATVTPSGWSLSVASYSAPNWAGAITMGGGMAITFAGCTITMVNGTVLPISGVNIGWPVGSQFIASAGGIHYTSSGCAGFGIPASGTTMTYSGTFDVPGLYVN